MFRQKKSQRSRNTKKNFSRKPSEDERRKNLRIHWPTGRKINDSKVLFVNLRGCTLPETNSSPLKIGLPNRKVVFQPSIFRGYVSFREGKSKTQQPEGFRQQLITPAFWLLPPSRPVRNIFTEAVVYTHTHTPVGVFNPFEKY